MYVSGDNLRAFLRAFIQKNPHSFTLYKHKMGAKDSDSHKSLV